MTLYNFLAGEAVIGAGHDLIEISSSLQGVFANLERNVDRFGNSRGNVVKYSEKNLHRSLLHPENGGVELFSQPILAKDECEEVFNCELAALFSLDRGLAISTSSNIFSIEDLLIASSACSGFLDRFDYLYGYRETQAFRLMLDGMLDHARQPPGDGQQQGGIIAKMLSQCGIELFQMQQPTKQR